MEKLDRENINTKEHWDECYAHNQRGGWLYSGWEYNGVVVNSNLDKFLFPDILKMTHKPLTCIEVGGGTGYGLNVLSQTFPNIEMWNLDISGIAIEKGKKEFPHIHHICHDIHLPLSLNIEFDILICQETIEHLENLYTGVANMMDILVFGGLALFTFPLNEHSAGAYEHLWSFDYSDIRDLYFRYTEEVTLCKFTPIESNLHGCIKFWKTLPGK